MNVGDKIQVEIADIDQRGKISLVLVDEDAAAPTADAEVDRRGLTRTARPHDPRVATLSAAE